MSYVPSLIYILSSLIAFSLIYFHIPVVNLQQLTAVLLFSILIYAGRIFTNRNGQKISKIQYSIGLFLGSFFIQVLILATGGVYSSLLILIHLFTLGSSFLINIPSSMIFLLGTVFVLAVNVYRDPQIFFLFKEDPGSTILYFMSFVVVVPLAQYLVYRYHLKDTFLKVLKEYAEIGEKRESSILNNIAELVVVTDKNLNILSMNEALENSISMTQDTYLNKSMFEVVPLKDQNNQSLSAESLSIMSILNDKATRIVDGFYYQSPTAPKPRLVSIQIRPILDSKGDVSQMIFLITEPQRHKGLQKHSDLKEALSKQQNMIDDLKNTLIKSSKNDAVINLELIKKTEEDLFLAYEIEDHPIITNLVPEDVALIGKQAVISKLNLANALGVKLNFQLPGDTVNEESRLHLIETNAPVQALPVSQFTAPVDIEWFRILLNKLLDIALLLVSANQNREIKLSVENNKMNENLIDLSISFPYQYISEREIQKLFIEYYAGFGAKSNLNLGSGLEGFIIHHILTELGIPFSTKYNNSKTELIFNLSITKYKE